MDWMRSELERDGVRLDAVYFCPYHPEHGIGAYRREHEDRKPSPGMLRRAAADLGLSLAESILVGDRCSDVAAANAAGLRQAFLLRGTEKGAVHRGCARRCRTPGGGRGVAGERGRTRVSRYGSSASLNADAGGVFAADGRSASPASRWSGQAMFEGGVVPEDRARSPAGW